MKNILLLITLVVGLSSPVYSQIDTSYVYNPDAPYGTLDIRIAKSETRYYFLQEDITFSFRESAPGVRTNTFLDMTSWDSSPYTEGNLREQIGEQDHFVMNYRLLKPVGYNPSYAKGYPIILMMHGSGEKGNCWNSNCYHATPSYMPATNDPPAPTSSDFELLNNDHNLLHGGKVYLDAVNLAGDKLPDDPTLGERAFPGFVLFPQSLNGWNTNAVQDAIRIVRLLVKKYNIDEDRIFINGLSNGGHGVFDAMKRAPWMFSSAIVMSAVDDAGITASDLESTVAGIPMWVFQGALDMKPSPKKTANYVNQLRGAGTVIRYTEYADVGHTTWNRSYKEPDFFTWMLGTNKSAIHVFAGSTSICNASGDGLPLRLPEGFAAYQWEKDGQVIAGATSATYMATSGGKYRARFSRTSATPTEGDWNEWSPEIELSIQSAPEASVNQIGTVVLNDLNNGTSAILEAGGDFAHYYWYKDGTLLDFPGDQDDTLRTVRIEPAMGNGAYTLVAANYDNCNSAPTDAKYIFFNNSAPVNITAPSEFTGTSTSSGSIELHWNDNATTETGYEIWRRKKTGESSFSSWEMATLTAANATVFEEEGLEPSTNYQYKIRAVSNSGRSEYTPAAAAEALEVSTTVDTSAPATPTGLRVTRTGLDKARVIWEPATDDTGIKEYIITYGDSVVHVPASDTIYNVQSLLTDTTYHFTVQAIDLAGNASAPTSGLSFATNVTGLFFEHSPGYWPSLDSIDWNHPEVTGFVNNFTLSPKTQDDYFYFRFDGFLYINKEGNYKFRISSNDGSRLRINGNLIADNNGIHDFVGVESAAVSMSKGAHRIAVDFFEYSGADSLSVEYNGPDSNNEWIVIPEPAFRSNVVVATEPTLSNSIVVEVYPNPAEPFNLNVRVESLDHAPVRIDLIDPIGRVITQDKYDISDTREGVKLNPQGKLTNGMYIIQVNQNQHVSRQKVLIRNP